MEPIENRQQQDLKFHASEFKLNPFSWLLTFFLCIIWPVGIILKFTLGDNSEGLHTTGSILNFYITTIGTQLVILGAIILVVRKEKSDMKSVGLGKFKLVYVLDAVLFQLLAWFVLNLASSVLIRFRFIEFYDTTPLLPSGTTDFVIFLILCIVAGVVEEIAFRGYLISRLTRITGLKFLAVFLATLAFSAGHIYQGTGGFILIFLYGLMFAVLYFITRSIWPCMIAHFIHNSIAPVMMRFLHSQ